MQISLEGNVEQVIEFIRNCIFIIELPYCIESINNGTRLEIIMGTRARGLVRGRSSVGLGAPKQQYFL